MSNYNILIDKLVSKLTLKQYSNYIINLVNKRDYVKIIELTDDLDMFDILADIEKERQRIADNLEKNLGPNFSIKNSSAFLSISKV